MSTCKKKKGLECKVFCKVYLVPAIIDVIKANDLYLFCLFSGS